MTYETVVAIAAPKAPINGVKQRFKRKFKTAPVIVDFAMFFESIVAEKKPPKYPDKDPNNIAMVSHGTYIQAL